VTNCESKGDAFPWKAIAGAKGLDLLHYQVILWPTKNGSQMSGRKTLQQETELEGAAYADIVRLIDRSCLREDEIFIVVQPEKPKR
jgi:hypothetical protein